ncbi:Linear gramicidin dehydrogenase LgrE [Streptomyces sp. YIM 130001]|uniref:thioesterase II family protein n=1 Tax=Streptomyces sp. YIM 130001 TaxID=2259644 RepID=UPI000E65D41F|nr:alpha/beta fold hydrolase [Streptomyces sp. YIM 130001]RII13428.1 Linear gramicidin dehydrogenase LgrE [Streptomyces sp. YIM 130001]
MQQSLRLFVFHHAGGSHLLYRDWPDRLPAHWDVRLMDAPGRGRLTGQPPIDDARELAGFFLRELAADMTGPFAFFGHSMGALVAYEMTQRLAAEGRQQPVWLGLSARGAPRPRGEDTRRHALPDDELRLHLAAMGGTPVEVLQDADLWEMFAPAIRNDLKLVESWRPLPGTPALTVPVAVYGGVGDVVVPVERLAAWEQHTERFQGLRLSEGGHFYFQSDPRRLLDMVARDANAALSAAVSRA